MRAKLLWAIGLFCFFPGWATAAPHKVLSGEHSNFTRLVTPIAGRDSWAVTQRDDQVFVTFEAHDDGFDTNGVFDLIPRSRISQVSSGPNTLTLTLGCDCAVATLVVAGPYLVIDVAETGVKLAGDPITKQLTRAEVPQEPAPQAPAPQPAPVPLPVPSARAQVIPLLPSARPSVAPSLNFPQLSLDRSELGADEQQILTNMQEQLAEQLGSAATQGVLTPVPGRAMPAVPGLQTPDEPELAQDLQGPAPELGPLANIRISSSVDLPAHESDNALGVAGLSCPPKGAFDLPTWGTTEPFSTQIGNARIGLYGELDRLDHSVATQLAQRYLYFGFGAEARQILHLDPALAQAEPSLLLIADILDDQAPRDGATLLRNPDCDAEVVLWATLALPDPVQGAKPDADAALLALNNLPVHLRQILAPQLSQKLLAFGDAQSAAQALRSLERQPDPLLSAARLAQAELDLHNGDTHRGTTRLEEVADENTTHSPAALIALIDAQIAAHQPVSFEDAELVAAYAHELQATELGPELRRTHILALLKTGQFDAAFEANEQLGGAKDTPETHALRGHLLRELAASADDVVFLEHIFAQEDSDIAQLPANDLSALAQRFLNTGFAQRAETTLDHLPDNARKPDQKILAAKIALALGKPLRAQASLLGVEGDPARSLRADAKRMAGAHDEAHDLYLQTAQTQNAAETAWLAEDWQGLTTQETPVFGPASQLAAYSETSDADTTGMMARSIAALDESAAARQTLSDLLGAVELQMEPEN